MLCHLCFSDRLKQGSPDKDDSDDGKVQSYSSSFLSLSLCVCVGGGGAVAQSPDEEVLGSIPAVVARSLLIGSMSV